MDEFTYMFLGSNYDNDDQQEEASSTADSNSIAQVDGSSDATANSESDTTTGDVALAAPPPVPETPKKRRGIREFLSKANLQDQLLDKLFQRVIPIDGMGDDDHGREGGGASAHAGGGEASDLAFGGYDDEGVDGYAPASPKQPRPGFSVAIMSTNFRRFNARIGVVFRFQKRVERLLAWRRTSHTLSLLGVYTFVCLDPYLLTLLPPAVLLLAVLTPGFIARHPGTPMAAHHGNGHAYSGSSSATGAAAGAVGRRGGAAARRLTPSESYYARGPPLAPPRTVKPVKELSRDFFRNMGDLQNSMEDFSVAHDQVVQLVVPATNFSDEAFSSALYVALFGGAVLLSVAAHLLPWRVLFLVGGWLVVGSGHPAAARLLRTWKRARAASAASSAASAAHGGGEAPSPATATASDALSLWNSLVVADMILDEPPETREVEIFELQRRSHAAASEWEPWVFSPSPYDPLSQPRLDRRGPPRPSGARFFEDVLPPQGWEWSEKKWALDLWSREWVEERIITGVEVETEGERWVYDMYTEQEQQERAAAAAAAAVGAGLGDGDYYADVTGLHPEGRSTTKRSPLGPSWEEDEEDEDGVGRRGEWRRRRWVRMVKRKKITEE